jgi:hypothetical protein
VPARPLAVVIAVNCVGLPSESEGNPTQFEARAPSRTRTRRERRLLLPSMMLFARRSAARLGGELRYWMSTGAPTGTRLNRSITSATCMRMQPCDAREPIE